VSFVSTAFVVLFAVVMAARLTIGRRRTEPSFLALLLGASVVFYAWHIPAYLLILLFTTVVDYSAARLMGERTSGSRWRRWILLLSVLSNLGILAFFKYANFLTAAAQDLAALAGRSFAPPFIDVVLPMGISFYTFQNLSYTIDVYRGRLAPMRSFWRFFLFIIFFPQLVAGPIVRGVEFLPQIARPRRLRLVVFYEGIWLIVVGYFLKVVCADNLAVYVDEHWDRGYRPDTDAVFALWLALMFSGQIFADFAGYSSIARGLGYLLGFRFPVNFDAPYIAGSFKSFWERWHITLSRWLRDYLYVPLGGNRRSRARTYVNLLLVMLLGGLWHGAAYTFIVWGAIHGICLAVERALGLQDHRRLPRWLRLGWFVAVQSAVLVAWVFFRSDDFAGALQFARNLFELDGRLPDRSMLIGALFLAPIAAMHFWTWLQERGAVRRLGVTPRAILAACMVYATLTLYAGASDFIYFQF
jgi:alginate O-acetyltransferase complex protein AlgI